MEGRKDFEWLIKEDNVWLISLCLVAQTCLTLCDHMDCSPLGSSVYGSLQARILKWVSMPSSRGSSQPRDRTRVSCITGRFFTTEPPGKPGHTSWCMIINKMYPYLCKELVTTERPTQYPYLMELPRWR